MASISQMVLSCPKCGYENVPERASHCPGCGMSLRRRTLLGGYAAVGDATAAENSDPAIVEDASPGAVAAPGEQGPAPGERVPTPGEQTSAANGGGPTSPTPDPARPGDATLRRVVEPPVLASRSLAEEAFPIEPGRRSYRTMMLTGGLLLLATFFAPVRVASGGTLIFVWTHAADATGGTFATGTFAAIAGAALIICAALPLPYIARALAGMLLGLVPICTLMAGAPWREALTLGSIFLAAGALFHRWRYRKSLLARLLIGIGLAGLLATLLIPTAGEVPLVAGFAQLDGASAVTLLRWLEMLVLMILALLSLLAFLGSGTGLAQVWAMALILYLPLSSWSLTSLQLGNSLGFEGYHRGAALLVYLLVGATGAAQLLSRSVRGTGPIAVTSRKEKDNRFPAPTPAP